MERLALIARLKEGTQPRAGELIAKGPPFDLQARGFVRHSVVLSATDVIFVFEAPEVESLVSALVDDPFQFMIADSLEEWRPLVEGEPRIAREQFSWQRDRPAEDQAR